jgi:hypothetical protein
MIKANDYEAFRKAAANGKLEVLQYLAEQAPAKLSAMVEAKHYGAFRDAARYGRFAVLQYLEEKRPNIRYEIIISQFVHYLVPFNVNDRSLSDYFLEAPAYFNYAALHIEDNTPRTTKTAVQQFMRQKLAELELSPATIVLSQNETAIYYQILKHMVIFDDEQFNNKIEFLLNIESLRALAANNPLNEPNHLLLQALQNNNAQAVVALLAIPAVNELAQANNMYVDRVGNNRALIDLMDVHRKLSPAEENIIAKVKEHYSSEVVAHGGADAVIQDLRNKLKKAYWKNPSIVRTTDGRDIHLPFDAGDIAVEEGENPNADAGAFPKTSLDAFLQQFNPDTQSKILQAYYANPYHTSYRYLLDSNPFLAAEAPFTNPAADGGKYSNFKDFKEELAIFYLGAIDEEFAPQQEGSTIADRFAEFARTLAEINQAHTTEFSPGDNPSCKPGTMAYIMKSVQDHVLFNFFSKDTIKIEYKSFIQEHYAAKFAAMNLQEITQIYQASQELVEDGQTAIALEQYNLSEQEQEGLIASLAAKYPEDLNEGLKMYARSVFNLKAGLSSHIAANLEGFIISSPKNTLKSFAITILKNSGLQLCKH